MVLLSWIDRHLASTCTQRRSWSASTSVRGCSLPRPRARISLSTLIDRGHETRSGSEPHPGRLRRHPPRAVGGRRRTPTRRPPRRSPLVAHPRPATANAEPGTRNPRRRPSDQAHDHDLTRQAATAAALGAASRVRSEPLKTSTHHNAGEVFRRACCRTLLLIKDGLFEVVPGIYQVRGYDISVRDGPARRCEQLPGDASDLRKHDVPPRGTPGGGTKAVMPPPHHWPQGPVHGPCGERTTPAGQPRTTTGNPPGGMP